MIRYYLLLFIRNLRRQKLFSFINLLGLTVSMASTLLIYLYVRHELGYDQFHPHAARVYRVNQTFIWGDNVDNEFASTGPGVAHALREELPEVELITSLHTPGNYLISYATPAGQVIALEQQSVLAADSNFFKMFNFPLVEGNAASALQQANTMVMTASTAKKYFGTEKAVGKLVRLAGLNGTAPATFEVTAVVEDVPDNSYIEFDVLLSMTSFPVVEKFHWSWVWTQLETFVRLREGTNVADTRARLAAIPRKHAETTLQRVMNTSYDAYIKSGKKWDLFLQPLTSIHLPDKVVYNRVSTSGSKVVVYSLVGAAVFIVLLSCVNFMNLSTAQFTRRIKEASIRKILGLDKKALAIGYFFEALALCGIALLTGVGLSQLLLPAFNVMAGKTLSIDFFGDPLLIAGALLLMLLMAALSSSYPALFLTTFNPVEAIKGKLRAGREGRTFRNSLVVFQFSVSIVLMICTQIVFQQLTFMSEKDVGFDKQNLLVLRHAERLKDSESLMQAARNVPGVMNASVCTSLPPNIWGGDKFSAEGTHDVTFPLNYATADERYVPTLGVKLKYGRNFSEDSPGDADRVILNETAIRRIGWPVDESAIGKRIESPGGGKRWEVIGVLEDFNYWSLDTPIEPFAIFHMKADTNYIFARQRQFVMMRIAPQGAEAWEKTLASLNALWIKHTGGETPFQYDFVDQTFAEAFDSHRQFGTLLTVMAALAMLIACLGLLGMIIYALEQRTKEIGIRKVSGASVWNILVLVTRGYTRLIVLAFVIGAPVSYWMMQRWLQGFQYRIEPSLVVFASVGIGTLLVAVAITAYHSVKAALTNPVEVLKDE